MRRVTTVPGGKIEELIVAWNPGQRWAFTGTAVGPGIVRALLEDCRIDPPIPPPVSPTPSAWIRCRRSAHYWV